MKLPLRLLITGFILALVLSLPGGLAIAETVSGEPGVMYEEGLGSLKLEDLEKFKHQVDGELSTYLSGTSLREWFTDFIRGEWKFDTGEVVSNLGRFFFKEVRANSHLLGKLLILAVVTSLLVNLQSSFGGEGIARISYLVCFLALLALALGSFHYVLEIGYRTINNMSDFMVGALPQMMILVAGMGAINTSAMMFPVMATAATALANGIKHLVFPLIVLSAVLSLLDLASDTVKVQRLGELVRTLVGVFLGLFMTIFVGLLGIKTIYGTVLDKMTLKTTQFAASLFPVIGKLLSDAVEFTLGYVVILKQALSVFGMVIIIGLCVFPILKIGAMILIYKVAAALVEPLGDTRTAQALEVMAKHLVLVLASTAAVALMFLIMITIVAGVTNPAFR